MDKLFSKPTRQNRLGVLINSLDFAQKTFRVLIPVIAIAISKLGFGEFSHYMYFFLIFLLVTLLYGYLKYKNFSFYLDEQYNDFVLNEGIVNHSKISIPLDKIQDVQIKQTIVDQIISVYRVEINSPGSSQAEVIIPAMSYADANALKQILLKEADYTVSKENIKEDEPERKLSILTLVKVGLTSNYIATSLVLLALFNFGLDKFRRFKLLEENEDIEMLGFDWGDFTISTYVILTSIFLGIIIFLSINVLRTLIKYWEYTINYKGHVWSLSYGLFNKRSVILRPGRVQFLAITQNYFSAKIGLYNLDLKQIGGVDEKNKNEGVSIPGCSKEEKKQVLNYVFTKDLSLPKDYLVYSSRYLFLRVFWLSLLPSIGISAWALSMDNYLWLISGVLYFIVASLMIYRYYRIARFYYTDDLVVIRTGIWDITYRYLSIDKIQTVLIRQYFWQKKLNIGGVVINTAGGRVTFSLTSYDVLCRLRNHWLYHIESQESRWM